MKLYLKQNFWGGRTFKENGNSFRKIKNFWMHKPLVIRPRKDRIGTEL